jgi:hypothetical protein
MWPYLNIDSFVDFRSLAEYVYPLAKVRELPHITDTML